MLRPEPGREARRLFKSELAAFAHAAVRPTLSLGPAGGPPRGEPTEAIRRCFAETPHDRPVLAVDLSVVEWNYRSLALALPDTEIYYAVKANPAAELVDLLAALGSHFDVASRGEIELCLSRGIAAERLSFGNTIKKERDIAFAHEVRSEEHTSELQSLMRNSYAVLCLKKKRYTPGTDVDIYTTNTTSNE